MGDLSLEPRRLPLIPISPPHPFDALPRRDRGTWADVTVHDLGEMFAEFVGKLRLIGEVVQRAVARARGNPCAKTTIVLAKP